MRQDLKENAKLTHAAESIAVTTKRMEVGEKRSDDHPDGVAIIEGLEGDIEETRALVELIIRALVDTPDAIRVMPLCGQQSVILEVAAAADDIRRIIGRRGRTAEALREILLNLGAKGGRRYSLQILEPI